MRKRSKEPRKGWAAYYDEGDILDEILDEDEDVTLAEGLREEILSGKRKRRLQSVTLKLDPLQVRAIKKLATMKAMPYQTLIRHWLAEDLKKELDSVAK